MKRAILVLATSVALFLSGAHAATRVTTPETPFTNIMNAAQSAIGLPYGDAAFFGPEFTSEHTAGSRFQAGQSVPSSGISAAKVKVAIKPVVTVNPLKLAKSAVSSIKGGGVPGIVASAAVSWAINQIPGASFDPAGNPVRIPSIQTSGHYWPANLANATPGHVVTRHATAEAACKSLWPQAVSPQTVRLKQTGTYSYDCVRYDPWSSVTETYIGYTQRTAFNCPNGVDSQYNCNSKQPTAQPFGDLDYSALEDAIAQVKNSDWLRDLTKAKCAGSLSPESCYQDLVDRRPNHGPASQTISSPAVTTSTTNPDGTTSTTTKTTSHKYDYTYTHNSYDYKVTTTTTTTTNGKTTTEVTTEEPLAPGEQPQEEPKDEDEEMPEVTDLYKPYIDKLNDIKTDVSAPPAVVPSVGYSAWYSFGGGCSEISVDLPIIGSWSTGYCPYIIDWVRPILAFLFVVFTWHYCRELWSEAVTQARPM